MTVELTLIQKALNELPKELTFELKNEDKYAYNYQAENSSYLVRIHKHIYTPESTKFTVAELLTIVDKITAFVTNVAPEPELYTKMANLIYEEGQVDTKYFRNNFPVLAYLYFEEIQYNAPVKNNEESENLFTYICEHENYLGA